MPIPVCFMVMPFGKKLTHAEGDKVPSQIDFDLLWDKVLRPMIQDGLRYIPVRADQDAGSLIIEARIERLAISDLVIADLTLPNANVYYQVGVRHAAQKQGCVLIPADWSKPQFDMSQMRRVKYPLPDAAISDEAAAAIRKILEAGVRQSLNGTVLAMAGRRIDAEGAEERRFPPGNEAMVGARMRNMMVSTTARAVVCSAACGADILALETAAQLGLGRRVVLPFGREQFRATSVADRGEDWGRRFDMILQQLAGKDILELNLEVGNHEAYARVNAKILDEAAAWASNTNRRTLAAVVWNGLSRGATDLTEAFRRLAVDRKMEAIFVSTL